MACFSEFYPSYVCTVSQNFGVGFESLNPGVLFCLLWSYRYLKEDKPHGSAGALYNFRDLIMEDNPVFIFFLSSLILLMIARQSFDNFFLVILDLHWFRKEYW